ncbi:MAG: flagellar assembly protein FliW [Candidatus Adiutrix sp.]|jgi:flagellar assembly factor FliW|nr:flagellar assembly protein FliW [Candidatus Adiutrix sp.]
MIKINTKRFGEMEFSEDSVVRVLGGLIGLGGLENYVIIRYQDESPFYWLQCVDDPDLALIMINPLIFKPDYAPAISPDVARELEADVAGELSLFVIVTIPAGNPTGLTANLLGPVAVNPVRRLARQLVLDDRLYSHRHPVMANAAENPETA